MLYFTSDLHLGHEGVLKYRRAFSDICQMDRALVENWNSVVTDEDTVVIVGDLFGRDSVPRLDVIRRLRGRKILVKGNHEAFWIDKFDRSELDEVFDEICDVYRVAKDGVKLFFCHYPMVSWEGSRMGSLLICGHMHARPEGYEYDLFRQVPLALNAGVDLNDFRPATLSQLIRSNERFNHRERTTQEIAALDRAAKIFG